MGSALGRDPLNSCVLEAKLLAQENDLLLESFVLLRQADPSVEAVGGDGACGGQGEVSQRDGLHDRGAESAGPAFWQRELRDFHDGPPRVFPDRTSGDSISLARESVLGEGGSVVVEIGRNDPCPCGSGKKYKRCCQTGPLDLMEEAARRVRRIQDQVEPKVVRFVRTLLGENALEEAWEEFACGHDELEREGPEFQLFHPWVLYDWVPPIRGRPVENKPVAGLYLDAYGAQLPPEEARFLESTLTTPISFHDVIEVEPGRRIRVRDVLLQTEQEVFEKSGSETLQRDDVIFARVVPYDGVALIIGSGSIPLPPIEKQPILRLRERLTKKLGDPTPDMLRAGSREFRTLYLSMRDKAMNPALPVLNNTDGDPLELHTITCDVESAEAAFHAFRSLAAGEAEGDLLRGATLDRDGRLRKVEFAWTKAGNKMHRSWENTVLGHVTIDGTKLRVEVNSARRARRIQAEIRKRLGATARNLTVGIKPIQEALQDYDRIRDTAGERKRRAEEAAWQAKPEVQDMMRQVVERQWEDWLREEIPALDGKTPFQAVRSPEGREMVEGLLAQFERYGQARSGPRYDFNRLRRKLGLLTRERRPDEPTI